MKSIKITILTFILLGTILASTITVLSCYWLNRNAYLKTIDAYLYSSATLISNLPVTVLSDIAYKKLGHMKIWIRDKDHLTVFKNHHFPNVPALARNTSATTTIDHKRWRINSYYNDKTGETMMLAVTLSGKLDSLYLGYNSCYFVIAIIVLLSAIFYFLLSQSLMYIPKLSAELNKKASNKLEPIKPENYPKELQIMIIELNQLFFRVQDAFNRNKRFSADAAHELRTPLTALKTQTQLALQMTDPKEQNKALNNVLISVNRSIHVVQQLLTLSRLDHEQELNDVVPVSLESICAEMIAYIYPHALDKRIEIELINQEDNKAMILGNDASLGILLRNLLDNAIRYTPEKGRINVVLEQTHNFITLTVSDNGPGIPEQFSEKVFDRFFRVLGTKQTGSGLGLAIVKQITDLHGAQIFITKPKKSTGLEVNIKFKKYTPSCH